MKKILATLAIAAIVVTSTFASTDTNNTVVNAFVSENPYTFQLMYSGENADTSNTALKEEAFNLADETVNSTGFFSLQRSSGNLNKDLSLFVHIKAFPFEGEINGETVKTSIIPTIGIQNKSTNSYTDIRTRSYNDRNVKTFKVKVPYGYNSDENFEIAAFTLSIIGDATTSAGTYKSYIKIDYTYDQT